MATTFPKPYLRLADAPFPTALERPSPLPSPEMVHAAIDFLSEYKIEHVVKANNHGYDPKEFYFWLKRNVDLSEFEATSLVATMCVNSLSETNPKGRAVYDSNVAQYLEFAIDHKEYIEREKWHYMAVNVLKKAFFLEQKNGNATHPLLKLCEEKLQPFLATLPKQLRKQIGQTLAMVIYKVGNKKPELMEPMEQFLTRYGLEQGLEPFAIREVERLLQLNTGYSAPVTGTRGLDALERFITPRTFVSIVANVGEGHARGIEWYGKRIGNVLAENNFDDHTRRQIVAISFGRIFGKANSTKHRRMTEPQKENARSMFRALASHRMSDPPILDSETLAYLRDRCPDVLAPDLIATGLLAPDTMKRYGTDVLNRGIAADDDVIRAMHTAAALQIGPETGISRA